MTILLLTKSLSFEQEFVRKLNSLGHEVLCSKQFFFDLLDHNRFKMDLNYFDTLILSETISDKEAKTILPFFQDFSCTIFRKSTHELDDERQSYWENVGVSEFIFQSTCFDDLREKLIKCDQIGTDQGMVPLEDEEFAMETLFRTFSKQELKIFKYLQQAKGSYVSRETLSYHLWGTGPSKSKESRLSGIIRTTKKKMSAAGFDDNCLGTAWGRGYNLEELVLKTNQILSTGDYRYIGS